LDWENDADLRLAKRVGSKSQEISTEFQRIEFHRTDSQGADSGGVGAGGRINVYNILAAIGAGIGLGIPNDIIETGIRNLHAVAGRFQRIDEGQPFLVVVDYAHTDDALQNLIRTARELIIKGRIITLFGCGGSRDRTKRPIMARPPAN